MLWAHNHANSLFTHHDANPTTFVPKRFELVYKATVKLPSVSPTLLAATGRLQRLWLPPSVQSEPRISTNGWLAPAAKSSKLFIPQLDQATQHLATLDDLLSGN